MISHKLIVSVDSGRRIRRLTYATKFKEGNKYFHYKKSKTKTNPHYVINVWKVVRKNNKNTKNDELIKLLDIKLTIRHYFFDVMGNFVGVE